jgi:hypothetical protein
MEEKWQHYSSKNLINPVNLIIYKDYSSMGVSIHFYNTKWHFYNTKCVTYHTRYGLLILVCHTSKPYNNIGATMLSNKWICILIGRSNLSLFINRRCHPLTSKIRWIASPRFIGFPILPTNGNRFNTLYSNSRSMDDYYRNEGDFVFASLKANCALFSPNCLKTWSLSKKKCGLIWPKMFRVGGKKNMVGRDTGNKQLFLLRLI